MFVLVVVFVGIILITPPGQELISRVMKGQTFSIGTRQSDDGLDVVVSAHPPKEDVPINTESQSAEPTGNAKATVVVPDKIIKDPEVFLVQDNIYEYNDAEPLCRAYGARLATMSDMYDAWRNGADWCSYGWVSGHKIVFPTQKQSWLKLQESTHKSTKNKCGMPGLNGGTVRDRTARYGVHCFGVKPPTWRNYEANKMAQDNLTAREQEMKSRSSHFKSRINKYTLMPFKKNKWSSVYKTTYDN